MKTGIELIAKERQEQIEKHRRTVVKDVQLNTHFQLSEAASVLCCESWGCAELEDIIEDHCPSGWDDILWAKMMNKSYEERLILAGALIAAEIDRLNAIEQHESTK
jgi:hypothetical protein